MFLDIGLLANPFKLFPFEIWEQILETCEDPQTIQNVLTAYPIMEGMFMQNKPRWMMDLVIRFIRPSLANSDMLSCRRVCRRWSKAVDNYLEDNAYLYAVKVNLKNRSSPFYRDMEECPKGRNPFPGRVTELDFGDGEMERRPYSREQEDVPELFPGEFWMKTLHALEKFGDQLWSLWISSKRPERQHFYQRFSTALSLLPNLRSLNLDVERDPEPESVIPLEYVEALPPLPRLHTLGFDNMRPVRSLTNVLVLRYSAQIKYLRIRSSNWREEYSTLFPRLVSLIVDGIESHNEAANLLGALQAPKLLRLQLELSYDIGNIVSLLKGFPRIEKMRLLISSPEDGRCKKVPSNSSHGDTIPSLKSLSIRGTISAKINFDFLQSFPSLEYFRMEPSFHKLRYFKADGIHKLELWEKLPKLREILVDSFSWKPFRTERVHCTRAQYDRMREDSSQQKRKKKCAIL